MESKKPVIPVGNKSPSTPVTPKLVSGADVRIVINIYSPDHEPEEFRITIPDIRGIGSVTTRAPKVIAVDILNGLRRVFGQKVG